MLTQIRSCRCRCKPLLLSALCSTRVSAMPLFQCSPLTAAFDRVMRSFLSKRALPCAGHITCQPRMPPDSSSCPLDDCHAADPQSLLGHAYGVEHSCSVGAGGTAWHTPPSPLPPVTHEHAATILLSHLPLHRQPSSCGFYPDSRPIAPNFRLFSLRPWAVYSSAMPMQSSARLLREVRPLLVLSGDHHRWCKTVHSINSSVDAVEVTVGTFSWLQGSTKPSFGALLFTNSSEAAALFGLGPGCVKRGSSEWHVVVCPCWLPDNRVALAAYALFSVVSLFWLLLQHRGSWHAIKSWTVTCAAAIGFHVLLL